MFSAKLFSLPLPVNLYHGPSQVCNLLYLCLFARSEHRPSTKERHCFLFVAIFSISFQVYPISFVSFSVSLCQVFRGLPLLLFPGGFHVMACNDHSQIGAFCPQGAKTPFSGLKLGIFKYCVSVTSEIDIEKTYLAESITG